MPPRFRVEPHEWIISIAKPEDYADINGIHVFDGHLDDERLVNAVLSTIAAEPMWDYHFVDHWMTPYWEANARARRRELITIQRTEDVATSLRDWLSRPVERAVTVGLFRTSSQDTVCFRVDHRLADATSLRLFAAAVAAHYRAGSTPPQADAPIVRRTPRLLRRAVSRDMRRKLLAESRKLAYRERRRNASFRLPAPSETDPITFPRQLHYPAGAVAQLTARAMRDRATINMAIQAALTLAIRDVVHLKPGREMPQQHLVDLRRYLPLEERDAAACMMIGAAQMWLDHRHATSMEAALSEIRQQLNAQRGPTFGLVISPLPADLPFIRIGLRWIPYRAIRQGMRRDAIDMSLTPNIQITDLGTFGQPGDAWGSATLLNAFCAASPRRLPQISTGVSTCGTRLNISLLSGPDSFVRQLAERLDHHLAEYVGWTFGGTTPEPLGEGMS